MPEPAERIASVAASTPAFRASTLPLQHAGKALAAIGDQATFSIATFLTSIVLARSIPPTDYGAFSVVYSVSVLLAGLHNSLILEPMSVFGPSLYRDRQSWYRSALLSTNLRLALAMTAAVVLVGAVSMVTGSGRVLGPTFLAMGSTLLLVTSFGVIRRVPYLTGHPGRAWGTTLAYAATIFLGLAVLSTTGRLSAPSSFLLVGVAAAVGAATGVLVYAAGGRGAGWRIDRDVAGEHWRYGRWILAASVVYWLSTEIFNTLAATILSLEEAAALRAVQNLISPAVQGIAAVNTLMLPWASGRIASEAGRVRATLSTVSLILLGGALAYGAALIGLRTEIFEGIYGGRYADQSRILAYLVFVPIVLALASRPQILSRALQRPGLLVAAYGASAAVCCTAGVFLTARWRLEGAAIGLVMSFVTYTVVITAGVRRDGRART